MKVVQYKDFGGSDVIVIADVPKPAIKTPDDVLIQVKAAGVNPLDMKIRMGYMQKMRPVELPFTPGLEAAGVVVAVGENVKNFQVGDAVMAVTMSNAYAEFVTANQNFVSLKPENLSFVEAAALPVSIGTAQSILFTEGKLESRQKVFIQGAAGAVGAIMVQLAKQHGLYVVATASGQGIDLVKNLGADEVFDYKTQDATLHVKDMDLVADCAGGTTQSKLFRVLKKGGKLLSIAGMPSPELAQEYQVEARFVSSNLSAKNLENGINLAKAGKIKPIIVKTFSLETAAEAQDFLSAGGKNGKIVLTLDAHEKDFNSTI